jgi:hypothetical protein
MRRVAFLIFALAMPFVASLGQTGVPRKAASHGSFLVDQSKPYVYLEVDHIGAREPRNEEEPNNGIWLRLHNNCAIPIVIRTFGIPPNGPKGEIGVLDNVVPNPRQPVGDGVVSYGTWPKGMSAPDVSAVLGAQSATTKSAPSQSGEKGTNDAMPYGYRFPTSSSATLEPGQSVYFSLPRNHVSDSWHVEIPFRFDLKVRSPLRTPNSFIALYQVDLSGVKTQ